MGRSAPLSLSSLYISDLIHMIEQIPSGHKKVTERDRENIQQDGSNRAFDKMIEIDVARRGSRGHRGDMSELQEWMKEHGVGDAFNRVMLSSLA